MTTLLSFPCVWVYLFLPSLLLFWFFFVFSLFLLLSPLSCCTVQLEQAPTSVYAMHILSSIVNRELLYYLTLIFSITLPSHLNVLPWHLHYLYSKSDPMFLKSYTQHLIRANTHHGLARTFHMHSEQHWLLCWFFFLVNILQHSWLPFNCHDAVTVTSNMNLWTNRLVTKAVDFFSGTFSAYKFHRTDWLGGLTSSCATQVTSITW